MLLEAAEMARQSDCAPSSGVQSSNVSDASERRQSVSFESMFCPLGSVVEGLWRASPMVDIRLPPLNLPKAPEAQFKFMVFPLKSEVRLRTSVLSDGAAHSFEQRLACNSIGTSLPRQLLVHPSAAPFMFNHINRHHKERLENRGIANPPDLLDAEQVFRAAAMPDSPAFGFDWIKEVFKLSEVVGELVHSLPPTSLARQ